MSGPTNQSQQRSNQQAHNKQNKTQAQPKPKKIITPDEGEYVDFEEIKD
jgi:hypothetical protein